MGYFASKTDYQTLSEEMYEAKQVEKKQTSATYFNVGESPIYQDGASIIVRSNGNTVTLDLGKSSVQTLIDLLSAAIGQKIR